MHRADFSADADPGLSHRCDADAGRRKDGRQDHCGSVLGSELSLHFFTVYKQLENKQTDVKSLFGPSEAVRIVQEAIDGYTEKFGAAAEVRQ